MGGSREGRFVPYERTIPGREAVYTGERLDTPNGSTDEEGYVINDWPLWTWTGLEMEPCAEIDRINRMQESLGDLDDEVRRIRAHIASLAHCDNGFPVTVDELLTAIGGGTLPDAPFHNGCFFSLGTRGTQPRQVESMRVIDAVLDHYLAGGSCQKMIREFPHAGGFIARTYEWLDPEANLTPPQRLMLERMRLPFEFFTKRNPDWELVHRVCFGPDGRGAQLDAEIAALTGLPPIYPDYRSEYREHLAAIVDPKRRALYRLCGAIAHGVRELSDCHHSAFRWVERRIHAIGTGEWEIDTRPEGTERARLGRLLFGYTLGLDRWLLDTPMQFLLLDLGHIDLGFDPKGEILRVYAHLGEDRTPVKEWLVACTWYHMLHMLHFRDYYAKQVERAASAGITTREWFESVGRADAD